MEYRNKINLNGLTDSPPGRVATFLKHPEYNTTPHSCSLTVYKNDLGELLRLASRDLRGGSGEKVILDNFIAREPIDVKWGFYLSPDHPDFGNLSPEQEKLLLNVDADSIWIEVADSMEDAVGGDMSIEDSWKDFIALAERGKRVAVDLSNLRPYGEVNNKKLMASGPIGKGINDDSEACSFLSIYAAIAEHLKDGRVGTLLKLLGTVNDTLRRGGHKRGIITSSMRHDHPDFIEYLNVPTAELPGGHKKGARLTYEVLKDKEKVALICQKSNEEGVFLAKIQEDPEVFDNVCVGLGVPDRGTCLIWRVNLGQVTSFAELPRAFDEATEKLCLLHINWRKEVGDRALIYRPLEEDKQVGLCLMGMANFLRYHGITYRQMTDAIHRFIDQKWNDTPADEAVYFFATAYHKSTRRADLIMRDHGLPLLDRIHTVEPGQNHPYHHKDLDGFTLARGLFPPFARRVRRVSEHQENIMVHHGKVEIASEIGPKLHQEFCEAWQMLMTSCGRPHYISFDTWEEIDEAWLKDFLLRSPLQTKYYSEHRNFDQYYLAKSTNTTPVLCGLRKEECSVCAE